MERVVEVNVVSDGPSHRWNTPVNQQMEAKMDPQNSSFQIS